MQRAKNCIILISFLFCSIGCAGFEITPIVGERVITRNYSLGETNNVSTGNAIIRIASGYNVPLFSPKMTHKIADLNAKKKLKIEQFDPSQKWHARYQTSLGGLVIVNPEYSESLGVHIRKPVDKDWGVGKGWIDLNTLTPLPDQYWGNIFRGRLLFKRIFFRVELIYSGVSQNTIHLTYREFIDELARPAFFQSLVYDLDQSKQINFKGISLEIFEATNSVLTFKVVEEGELRWVPQ